MGVQRHRRPDSIAPSAAVTRRLAEFRRLLAWRSSWSPHRLRRWASLPCRPGPTGAAVDQSWRVRSAVGAAVLSELREAYREGRLLSGAALADERFERCFDEVQGARLTMREPSGPVRETERDSGA